MHTIYLVAGKEVGGCEYLLVHAEPAGRQVLVKLLTGQGDRPLVMMVGDHGTELCGNKIATRAK
jgi:hypothetical protein